MRKTLAQDLGLSYDDVKAGLALLAAPRTVRTRNGTTVIPPSIVLEDDRAALFELHDAELRIAKHVKRLIGASAAALELPTDAFGARVPDASQRAAVELALRSGVMVLTGGPGTGKTTVCRAIIGGYEQAGLTVVGCAPTGKAAQRMRQQTGRPASTIHNAIGLVPGGEPRYNAKAPTFSPMTGEWVSGGPMPAGAVICDESSMVDVSIFADLLEAIATGARVLIVGDVNQLPSIGAGRVLFDLIQSGVVPCANLNTIHRQASESRIPYVARDLNAGAVPDLTVTGSDFTHWETANEEDAGERIVRALTDPTGSITARKGIPLADVQVLAAQYKGPCGVVVLNQRLQEQINPAPDGDHNGDVFVGRGYSARLKDRVIQTRNNYDLGPVMNGEMGYVVACDPNGLDVNQHLDAIWSGKVKEEGEGASDPSWDDTDDDTADDMPATALSADHLAAKFGGLRVEADDDGKNRRAVWATRRVLVVDFGEGRKVAYSATEARELELGYAITVHRSQGSQWKAIVVGLHCQNAFMLTRALLYTAVTRAESFCLTVGTAVQMARAARNTRGTDRRTRLQQRLAATPIEARSSLDGLTAP